MGAGMTLAKRRLALNEPHLLTAQSDGILTFDTDMRAPLKALSVDFSPVQEGEGDPSPENVRPITGWDVLEISHTPRNILPKHLPSNAIKGTFSTGSTHISSATNSRCFAFYIGKNKRIRYRRYEEGAVSVELAFCDSDALNLTMPIYSAVNMTNRPNYALNSGDHPYLIVCPSSVTVYESGIDDRKVSVFFDDEDVGYSPRADWSPVPVSWASSAGTVYGGYLEWLRDGTVRVTKTMQEVVLDGSEAWMTYPGNPYGTCFQLDEQTVPFSGWRNGGFDYAISNLFKKATRTGAQTGEQLNTFWWNNARTGYRVIFGPTTGANLLANFKTFLAENPLKIVGTLATPVTYTLTPQEALRTLRGENNLWSDANGAISATYWKH